MSGGKRAEGYSSRVEAAEERTRTLEHTPSPPVVTGTAGNEGDYSAALFNFTPMPIRREGWVVAALLH